LSAALNTVSSLFSLLSGHMTNLLHCRLYKVPRNPGAKCLEENGESPENLDAAA
jgi:hypothetical protein